MDRHELQPKVFLSASTDVILSTGDLTPKYRTATTRKTTGWVSIRYCPRPLVVVPDTNVASPVNQASLKR